MSALLVNTHPKIVLVVRNVKKETLARRLSLRLPHYLVKSHSPQSKTVIFQLALDGPLEHRLRRRVSHRLVMSDNPQREIGIFQLVRDGPLDRTLKE